MEGLFGSQVIPPPVGSRSNRAGCQHLIQSHFEHLCGCRFHHFGCSSSPSSNDPALDLVQYICLFEQQRAENLSVSQAWPHRHYRTGKDHPPGHAGYILAKSCAVGLHQLMLNLLSTWADKDIHEKLFPTQSVTGSALLHGIIPLLDQDIAFAFIRLHDCLNFSWLPEGASLFPTLSAISPILLRVHYCMSVP